MGLGSFEHDIYLQLARKSEFWGFGNECDNVKHDLLLAQHNFDYVQLTKH